MAKSRNFKASFEDHATALQAACEALPRIVVAEGPEPYLRQAALHAFVKALRRNRAGIEEIDLHGAAGSGERGATIVNLLEELSSSSLFASEKAVLCHGAEYILFATNPADAEAAPARRRRSSPEDRLIEYLQNPAESIWLVMDCGKMQRNRRVGKALAKVATIIPCPALTRMGDVAAWMRRTAKAAGKTLDPGVEDILFTAHGGQLGALHAELEKLSTYVGKKTSISTDDVEAFLSGSIEFDVFGLTNAVEARDLSQALTFARRIALQGTRDQSGKKADGASSSHRALAMLATTFESILGARVAAGQGASANEIAKAVGTSPWRAERLEKAAGLYSIADLRRALTGLSGAVRSTHDTGGDVSLALERFLIQTLSRR